MIRIDARMVLRAIGRAAAVYGLAFAAVLHTPITDWFAYPLLPPADAARGDAIVVLSAWASAAGELNESGVRRALTAARLYHAGTAPSVLITGSRPQSPEEGDALQASVVLLEELRVPRQAITVEDRSANTRESAVNVSRLARQRGWSRVALVTDATHMRRARAAFAHEGLPVTCAPTMMWQIGGELPAIRLNKLDAVVHEYGGLLYYRARGWI